jgi:hypothetical protein
MDLAERLADLKEKNDAPPDLTDKQAKAYFLELLCEGETIPEAGRKAGRTASWFKRRRNPGTGDYDPAFREEFERITAPGGDNKAAIAEEVFSALVKAAKEGNVRAQEKVLAALDAEFAWLRPQMASGAMNVQQLQVFFGELPLEKLLELQKAREAVRGRDLPVLDQ